MKTLIKTVAIAASLVFVNGCIDETVAQEPEPEVMASWITFESIDTGAQTLINMSQIMDITYSYRAMKTQDGTQIWICHAVFNRGSSGAVTLDIGSIYYTGNSHTQCSSMFNEWIESIFSGTTYITHTQGY